jgi:hypothetical protein
MSVERASSTKWHQAAAGFLDLKKSMLVLLAMVILVGLGEKIAERFLPLYLVALGGGAFSIGLLNGADDGCSGALAGAPDSDGLGEV